MTRSLPLFRYALTALISVILWQPAIAADGESVRSYLEITPDNRDDLVALLDTMEKSLTSGINPTLADPVIIILHGEEAFSFTRSNYAANKALADRAALLDAYKVIDVRMCETWMNNNGVNSEDLLPYIETVPYAPEEVRKLEAEGYLPFGAVRM